MVKVLIYAYGTGTFEEDIAFRCWRRATFAHRTLCESPPPSEGLSSGVRRGGLPGAGDGSGGVRTGVGGRDEGSRVSVDGTKVTAPHLSSGDHRRHPICELHRKGLDLPLRAGLAKSVQLRPVRSVCTHRSNSTYRPRELRWWQTASLPLQLLSQLHKLLCLAHWEELPV